MQKMQSNQNFFRLLKVKLKDARTSGTQSHLSLWVHEQELGSLEAAKKIRQKASKANTGFLRMNLSMIRHPHNKKFEKLSLVAAFESQPSFLMTILCF